MAKSDPHRTCIATGESLPKEQLLRFVVGPDGRIVPDIKRNLPGKGIWLQPQRELLQQAIAKNLFSRAARQKVRVDEELPELVGRLLEERALAYLMRGRLAGELVNGHEKVASMLKSGEVAVLIHAEDAAEDGKRKLDKLVEGEQIVCFLSRERLAEALNLPNPVHLCLKKGGIAAAFLESYASCAGFHK